MSPGDAWLVGGHIRDILTGVTKRHGRDYDMIGRFNPKALAIELQSSLGGTVVQLRGESVFRLALGSGSFIDLSRLGGDIQADLLGRDYTINAIAWRPVDGFIDPSGGINDLKGNSIRHISRKNIEDDPLRLLRAYRLMAHTGFRIHNSTRKVLSGLSHLAGKSASERITFELIKTLEPNARLKALSMAAQDGVLGKVLGLSKSQISRNLTILRRSDSALSLVPCSSLGQPAGQGMNTATETRLLALVYSSDLSHLALNRETMRKHSSISQHMGALLITRKSDREGLADTFHACRDALLQVSVLTGKGWLVKEALRYRRIAQRPPLAAGQIMTEAGLRPGPALGRAIDFAIRERFVHNSRKSKILNELKRFNNV